MIALAAAVLVAALPSGAVRYRAELGGARVGVAELRIACAGAACEARSEIRLRLPAEAGGGVRSSEVEVEVDASGRWRGGALRFRRDSAPSAPPGVPGAVPSALVEVVLALEARTGEACVAFFDEERPAPRRACARLAGDALAGDLGGVPVRIVPGEGGFPQEVAVSGAFRFVRDPSAAVPARAPPLAGARVPGPADPRDARTFCGVALDGAGSPAPAGLPPPRAAGASCREKTAAWLAAARARGVDGRAAVGVAWDGAGFVWHEWAEVRSGGGWTAVDPSFGELPARGPRFTLGRLDDRDPAGRDRAGARILGCWGRARVE